jgi:Zn-dependent protease
MRWSIHLARILGIDVKIHVTFFLLLAFFAVTYARVGGAPAAIFGVGFVISVFVCVLLHEFGHALAARRYGIHTPDITLLPIGGVARLEKMPDKPIEEVVVAIAGPLVNVVIALVLWIGLGLPSVPDVREMYLADGNLLGKLLWVNVILVIFNMIPAFPMDGGRILRALIAMRMNYARATAIAAGIGQGIAFMLGLFALLVFQPILLLVAVFVYFGAQSEAAYAQLKDISSGMRVSAAMVTQFKALPPDATLSDAADLLLHTSQHEFPVMNLDGQVAGVLTRDDLIAGLRKTGAETPASAVMRTDIPSVHQSMLFERAFMLMQQSRCPALPVLDSAGRLVGLFTPENVGEMMMVHSALAAAPRRAVMPA